MPPLVQLSGTDACVTETGDGGTCADGLALDLSTHVVVSPDGRDVYVAANISDAVAAFDRDVVTGALTQKDGMAACVSDTGTGGLCRPGLALDGVISLAMSPDGLHLYGAALISDSVVVLNRSLADGSIAAATCVSDDGTGGDCTNGESLAAVRAVAISPDGQNVYAAAISSNAVAIFDRAGDGTLTQKAGSDGCVRDNGAPPCADGENMLGPIALAVSPDGRNLYLIGQQSESIAIFDRGVDTGEIVQKPGMAGCVSEDGSGAECVDGVALAGAIALAVSADGANVYVASEDSGGVAVFDRDLTTGELTQKAGLAGCVTDDGTGAACTDGVALAGAFSVAVSPDGESVYVGAATSNAVAAFDRDLTTGALTQKAGVAACVSITGTGGACVDGEALVTARGVAVSADGRSVYVASGFHDGVAVFTRDVPAYDIDGDGESEPLTDGLLLVRHRFGFTGGALVNGAVDLANCTRCTAPPIEAYIEALLGP